MKNSFLKIQIFSSLLLFGSALHGAENWNLSLSSSTLGDPQRLFFKEVVDKQKTSPALLEKYGNLVLPPVSTSGLQAAQVMVFLGKVGAPLNKIQLISPPGQKVSLSPKSVVLQKIREAVIQKAAEMHQVEPKSILLEISEVPEDLPAPDGFSRLQVELTSPYVKANFLGQNGEILKSSQFTAKVLIRSSVLLAKKALMPSQSIGPEDFEEKQQDLESIQGLVRGLSELKDAHWNLSQGLEVGSLLRREYLQKATSLQKGALVSLVKRSPQFQIQTLARVKEVLGNGEMVLVENLDTKKEITAKTLSSTEVEVVQ
ncbi:MAG: flagella basal body P-ring formation protein FlgA [Deltaproteobacteria bacterium]|nr:flagella basal body P-ring formation protein FlgA [Deltaproteobacteria bacterium]